MLYTVSELLIIVGEYLTFAKQDLTVKILVEPERMLMCVSIHIIDNFVYFISSIIFVPKSGNQIFNFM